MWEIVNVVISLCVIFELHEITTFAGYTNGAPCSVRNTIYLNEHHYPELYIPPEIQCLDITQAETKWQHLIHPNSLPYTGNITTLYADNMALQTVPFNLFKILPNLDLVDLSGNRLKKFNNTIIRGLQALRVIIFDGNRIMIPIKRSLLQSYSLTVLKLSRNGIGTLRRYTFGNLPALKVLYLDGNLLKKVPMLAFKNLHGLKYLDLSNNLLHKLPEVAVLPSNLVTFMVQGNVKMELVRKPRNLNCNTTLFFMCNDNNRGIV